MTCVMQGLIVSSDFRFSGDMQLRHMHAFCWHANDIQWGQEELCIVTLQLYACSHIAACWIYTLDSRLLLLLARQKHHTVLA